MFMMMPNRKFPIRKIISGGQTGVDRAALDLGLSFSIPIGGWCPKGRLAEDGPIPLFYPLQETPSSRFSQRTEWNVRDSDGTFVLTYDTPIGGTALTIRLAKHHRKPYLVLNLETAVGSQKSTQTLGAPGTIQKGLITTEVTTPFFISLGTPISYAPFLRPTAVSRLKVDQGSDATVVSSWLIQHDIHTLNIAGPRESMSTGIYESAYAFLHTFVHQYMEKYTSKLLG